MPVVDIYGDGDHDDTVALQKLIEGHNVRFPNGELVSKDLTGGTYLISDSLRVDSGDRFSIIGATLIAAGEMRDLSMIVNTGGTVNIHCCNLVRQR